MATTGRVIPLLIFGLAIVFILKGLVALTHFLRLHFDKIFFAFLCLWVVLDACQREKAQAKTVSASDKM